MKITISMGANLRRYRTRQPTRLYRLLLINSIYGLPVPHLLYADAFCFAQEAITGSLAIDQSRSFARSTDDRWQSECQSELDECIGNLA